MFLETLPNRIDVVANKTFKEPFVYKSPIFMSANNTKIVYVLPSDSKFFTSKANTDDSFTLIVDRSQITVDNSDSYKFSFGVKDGDLIY